MKFQYMEGITRAESQEMIVRSPTPHEDIHSLLPPLGSLGHFNTRGLDDTGIILATIAGTQKSSRALILGGGAGIACDDVKSISPNIDVEAIALTPFNPYVRILLRGNDIFTEVERLIGKEILMQERLGTTYDLTHLKRQAEYLAMSDDEYALCKSMVINIDPRTYTDTHVPTSLLETLQDAGQLQIFETLAAPICEMQHIGYFPNEFTSPKSFELIYDDKGPLYYVDREKRGTIDDATIQAVEHLSTAGILYVTHHDPLHGRAMGVRENLDDSFSDALFIQASPGLAVIRREHPLYQSLSRIVAEKKTKTERGVAYFIKDNIQAVIMQASNNT